MTKQVGNYNNYENTIITNTSFMKEEFAHAGSFFMSIFLVPKAPDNPNIPNNTPSIRCSHLSCGF